MQVSVAQVPPYSMFRTVLTGALGVRLDGETENGIPVLIMHRGRREIREDVIVDLVTSESEDPSGIEWIFHQAAMLNYGQPVDRRRKTSIPYAEGR